ncbi:hypothetical protein ACP70R_019735 [Stipagrostis hirtigluma subsp. patula]
MLLERTEGLEETDLITFARIILLLLILVDDSVDHVKARKRRCMPPVPALRATRSLSMASSALPADLLLEIIARSDAATFMRSAAACKSLRRDVLSPAFLRRVCRAPDGIFPARLLGLLDTTFSLVHPATPAAASFAGGHLAPFVSRVAADLLKEYRPVTSRGGLVLLERRAIDSLWQPRSERRRADELCVYNPTTGDRSFLPFPREIIRGICHNCSYVLLTAADGITGRSFLLLATDMNGLMEPSGCIRLQTMPSNAGGQWGPVTRVDNPSPEWSMLLDVYHKAGVVLGGVVHWLVYYGQYILTYDVIGTATTGKIKLSDDHRRLHASSCQLGSWPDGRLSLFGAEGFTVSVWVMSSGGGWARHAAVDTAAALSMRSLMVPQANRVLIPELSYSTLLLSYGDHRSGVVLLWASPWASGGFGDFFVVDTGTKEICTITGEVAGTLYEMDVSSLLSAMKIY